MRRARYMRSKMTRVYYATARAGRCYAHEYAACYCYFAAAFAHVTRMLMPRCHDMLLAAAMFVIFSN